MTQAKSTIGQAIDQIIAALENLDVAARATALSTVYAYLKIEQPVTLSSAQPKEVIAPLPATHPPSAQAANTSQIDIRTLKDQKKPKSARQMACIVAYYLQELAPSAEKKDSVSTADIEKYFKQAQYKLPTQIQQLLTDAKNSGYFDSAGRGEYKLNAVGYNLVAHNLPSTTSA